MASVVKPLHSVQYDGTNATAITAMIHNGVLIQDTGSFMYVTDQASDFSADTGDWFILDWRTSTDDDMGVVEVLTPARYAQRYQAS